MGGSGCTESVITLLRSQPAACHQVSEFATSKWLVLMSPTFLSLTQAQHIDCCYDSIKAGTSTGTPSKEFECQLNRTPSSVFSRQNTSHSPATHQNVLQTASVNPLVTFYQTVHHAFSAMSCVYANSASKVTTSTRKSSSLTARQYGLRVVSHAQQARATHTLLQRLSCICCSGSRVCARQGSCNAGVHPAVVPTLGAHAAERCKELSLPRLAIEQALGNLGAC